MGRVGRTGNKGAAAVAPLSMHVEIFKGEGREPWRVRLVGRNGEILNVSEGYFSKWNAKRAARRVFPNLELREVEK